MNNSGELLKVNHLTVSYPHHPPAVNDVSFCLHEGDIVTIVGESGSGKSTLLHSLLGLLPAGGRVLAGEIMFNGIDLVNCPDKTRDTLRGKDISMVFQNAGSHFDPIRKIGRQFDEMLNSHNIKTNTRQKQNEMLHKVHLSDTARILNAYPFELSVGMKQRVAIAMAMAMEPGLLLADEPTSALDVTLQAQIVQQMLSLCRDSGTAILMVTHNMGVAAYMADYIGVMHQGIMVEWGRRDAVIENPTHKYTRSLLQAIPELTDERILP